VNSLAPALFPAGGAMPGGGLTEAPGGGNEGGALGGALNILPEPNGGGGADGGPSGGPGEALKDPPSGGGPPNELP
jgi:hypothetical protein